MASHKATLKDIKKNEKRRTRNRQAVSMIRTMAKKVETLVSQGKKEEAVVALGEVVPVIDHAVNRRILHRNSASRKISRLTLKVNGLS
ncbi:30S ribosomal protein S20 [Leptospirillum ferriphilum]|uniref:Small ribosomal subunit protein bS20 n=3 Tax=Leptospirillum ferriphilum TaxID=178606 RepID=A0A059XT96_9BACT|nr:30S ribosomal protein S20 [Leptospirillum ferriphilum]EAY57646.1 MAG: ribosomal protein S20 [Leptospirillum rubarum]MCL5259788.1 30S ribosomal protein S20 [Nitrospirota bacterium]AFS52684.1 putative ribosomal protein S20 [Leptospirillum ferriphilum ML-04]AIA30058.1 30S ribosomal protein S20 [Leptospirillum ferriphilum YSK]OOH72853.1 30S ribosomal protein S20 [Leptospirillum ferriphilum]